MPNIDGGHYFLTALIPILLSDEVGEGGSIECPSNSLRKLLALMPTTGGGPEPTLYGSEGVDSYASPFARNDLNHFVRFAVIEDINYNGRINGNGLIEALRGVNPAELQPVDHLSRPYLLFAAEFDPNRAGAPEPDVYLDRLWTTMNVELHDIFKHCFHFDEVRTSGDFVRYIRRCQLETTMPFNDYWIDPLPLKNLSLPAPIGMALLIWGLFTFGISRLLPGGLNPFLLWPLAALLGFVPALIPALFIFGFAVRAGAAKPFPTAPDSDLKTILKALHLQRAFIDFAIANQGAPPDALQSAFGDFLDQNRLHAPSPTQSPGVVGA
jgi:hypothetical protein